MFVVTCEFCLEAPAQTPNCQIISCKISHPNILSVLVPQSTDFCLQADFNVKGIRSELFFFYTSWKNRIHFPLCFFSSSCFAPPPLIRPGTVYCLGKYFMTLARSPQGHSFTLLLTDHMNKGEETTGEAGCPTACFPQQVNPYRSLPRASASLLLSEGLDGQVVR